MHYKILHLLVQEEKKTLIISVSVKKSGPFFTQRQSNKIRSQGVQYKNTIFC